MLFSPGAPDTPSGGSSCNRLKSRINLRRAVVDILIETESESWTSTTPDWIWLWFDEDLQWNYWDWYREMSTLCKRRSRNLRRWFLWYYCYCHCRIKCQVNLNIKPKIQSVLFRKKIFNKIMYFTKFFIKSSELIYNLQKVYQ